MGDENLPHNIEAQAGVARLGGVERLENPCHQLCGDAHPAIADVQLPDLAQNTHPYMPAEKGRKALLERLCQGM